jgi:hypothetical protein
VGLVKGAEAASEVLIWIHSDLRRRINQSNHSVRLQSFTPYASLRDLNINPSRAFDQIANSQPLLARHRELSYTTNPVPLPPYLARNHSSL